jgi:hypothetical protein
MSLPQFFSAEARCESCGTWHSVTLRRFGDEPLTSLQQIPAVDPLCWVCGSQLRPNTIEMRINPAPVSPPPTHTSDGKDLVK